MVPRSNLAVSFEAGWLQDHPGVTTERCFWTHFDVTEGFWDAVWSQLGAKGVPKIHILVKKDVYFFEKVSDRTEQQTKLKFGHVLCIKN